MRRLTHPDFFCGHLFAVAIHGSSSLQPVVCEFSFVARTMFYAA